MTDEYDRIRIRDLTNDLAAAVARAERAERERDALQSRVDALDVAAKALPLGRAFHGGGLHDAPMFDVADACLRYMRGERSPLDWIVPRRVPASTEEPTP